MHYSKFIKYDPQPAVTPPVDQIPMIIDPSLCTDTFTYPNGETVTGSEFLKRALEKANPQFARELWASQENVIPQVVQPKQQTVPPELEKLVKLFETNDIVTKAKLNKLFDVMAEGLQASLEDDSSTILDEFEANQIMEYFTEIEEKYFEDIPLSERPSKSFVWNIPRRMYEGMIYAKENDLLDIFNPMILMYLAMTDNPALAVSKFVSIISGLQYDNANAFQKHLDTYKEFLDRADQGEEIDVDEAEDIAATFARKGYAAADEDS